MPTFTSTDKRLIPRSTLRHRSIAASSERQEPPRVRRATRSQAPQPAAKTIAPVNIPAWKPTTRLRAHKQSHIPMVAVGIGMVIAVMVALLGQLVIGWIGTTWNDIGSG